MSRAISPRREVRSANTFQSRETELIPEATPIHPDAAAAQQQQQQQQQRKGPAYAQSVYERRMGRSRSPISNNNNNSGNSGNIDVSNYNNNNNYNNAASAASSSITPPRSNINANMAPLTAQQLHAAAAAAAAASPSAANGYATPSRSSFGVGGGGFSASAAAVNYSTTGTTGGIHTPSHSILGDRQQLTRASPIAVVNNATFNNGAPAAGMGALATTNNNTTTTAISSISSSSNSKMGRIAADLNLTAPDRALLELLITESEDRHFVEKLFVAQEEKHERNQWASIEAHRRRMIQMSYAAPLRIARMEVAQEQRVGDLIAEYEVGAEVLGQRRKMDERVAELRSMIDTTARYREALEELEADNKNSFEREMGAIEDERRSKKRLLDELQRQYEFASVHSRVDDLYSPSYGLRVALENQQRLYNNTNRLADPDPLKVPLFSGSRAIETLLMDQQQQQAASATTTAPATGLRQYSATTNLLMSMNNANNNSNNAANSSGNNNANALFNNFYGNNNTNNIGAPSAQQQQQQQQQQPSAFNNDASAPQQPVSSPAQPLFEPSGNKSAANNNNNNNGPTTAASTSTTNNNTVRSAASPPSAATAAALAPSPGLARAYTVASEIIAQSQRALARAEELERSATADSRSHRF